MKGKKLSQHIETVIQEYLNASSLRDKPDAIQFNEKVFQKVGDDPFAALMGFGTILESSLFEVVKRRWDEIIAKAGEGKGPKPGLGTYISLLEKPQTIINEKILIYLGTLCAYRNHYYHERPLEELSENDFYEAQQCSLLSLHYLVWKYECWANDKPKEPPRSVSDKRLLHAWGTANVLETSEQLRDKEVSVMQVLEHQNVDAWGIASIKSRIHTVAEVVALEAETYAMRAAETYPDDAFTLLIPLICDLRWKRGYMSALRKLLKIPKTVKRLGEFTCNDVTPPCSTANGVLKAKPTGPDSLLIMLDNNPALSIVNLSPVELDAVQDAVNGYGRLGIPRIGGLTIRQRLEEIEIQARREEEDELVQALFRNRHALVPLIARFGLPGADWLLRTQPTPPAVGLAADRKGSLKKGRLASRQLQQPARGTSLKVTEEVFTAKGAIQTLATAEESYRSEQLEQAINTFKAFYSEEQDTEKAFRKTLQGMGVEEGEEDQILAMFKVWSLVEEDSEKIVRIILRGS